ncbi:MAG: oligosaccharide flippase family protein, partial [Candidatus Omnitrophica bacterium]|nr:oligosaccharide flippase family protein [Candidatus Omnitrophota bacterium]
MEINIKNIDAFGKNIILVLGGSFLVSSINLLYQLIIAHQLSPVEFATFNSLLSLFMLIAAPLGTLQPAVAKYSAEFHARNDINKVTALFSFFSKKVLVMALVSCFMFYFVFSFIIPKLKIASFSFSFILPAMLLFAWLMPVLLGGLQGLEFFKWLIIVSVIGGGLKLLLTIIFLKIGFGVTGALGGFLASSVIITAIALFSLKRFFKFGRIASEGINFKDIAYYLFPVAITTTCYIGLVNLDMVLVKYFFSPEDAGIYSLAQIAGKIFLFIPGAISIVMFPRVSRLNAKNENTTATLKRSLIYGSLLCIAAVIFYNLFPAFVMKILTGKVLPESIRLGRIFSISMTFFALLYILVN